MLGQTALTLGKRTLTQTAFVWLSGAGVTLFFAHSTYTAVKTSVVESWPRVTSKRITADLQVVAQVAFNFSLLEYLMSVPGQDMGEDE